MFSKTKQKRALTAVLDRVNPDKEADGFTRTVINWSMYNFRHALFDCADIPTLISVSFEFTDEKIKKQLTTAILKSETRTIRMVYDYRTDEVSCSCIGKDLDMVKEVINVNDLKPFVTKYLVPKKKVVIVRKKNA